MCNLHEVLIFRSVKSIVIAPAKTGRDRSNRTAVINTEHKNIGVRSNLTLFGCILTVKIIITQKISDNVN